MISIEDLRSFSLFQDLPPHWLTQFSNQAAKGSYNRNDFLFSQHDEAKNVFILVKGSVQFLIHFEGVDDLLVGTTRERGALIGWSAFRIPYRYTSSVRCEEKSEFYIFPQQLFHDLIEKDPSVGHRLLSEIATTLANRLEQTRDILMAARFGSKKEGK